jgi:predicted MFS family arabinose efflux permease
MRRPPLSDWPAGDRETLLIASIAMLGSFLVNATWSVVILPVQAAFGMSADGEVLLRQLPDMAALLVTLAIAAVGTSVSSRALLVTAAVAVAAGSLLATLGSNQMWLLAGASLMNAGRGVVAVAAFAAVSAVITHEGRRTTAFATLGAVPSIIYMVGPVLAAWLMGKGGWRMVGLCWVGASLLLALAAWRCPRGNADVSSSPASGRGELWTPIAAGVALVALVQWLGSLALHGPGSRASLVWSGVTVAATVAWILLVRWLPTPSLTGRTLRSPGLVSILIVAMVAQCGDLWFYVAAAGRFLHGLGGLEVSLFLLAPQIAAFLGACAAGWLTRRIGLRASGSLLLATLALAMSVANIQPGEPPFALLVAVLCVAAVGELGASVCLSQAIMSCAGPGMDRSVACCRSVALGVGNALTLLLVVSSVAGTMGESIRHEAQERHAAPPKVDALVTAIRDNVPTSEIGRDLDLSQAQVQELRQVRREVMVDGFRAHGWVSGGMLALAALGFWVVQRGDRDAAPTSTGSGGGKSR